MTGDGIRGAGPSRPADLLEALKGGRIQGERARLRAASQLMEGQFYQQLFSAMRATVPEGGLMSGGEGEEMFTTLLDQKVADAAAVRESSGLGRALYRHFVGRVGPDEAP